MSYCSVQDVIDRLSETGVLYVADDDGNGSLSSDETQRAIRSSIDAADAEIDAALASRVTLPIGGGNEWLRYRSVDLSAERLAERKGQSVPTSLKEAARRSRQWLEEVRQGTQLVPGLTLFANPTSSATSSAPGSPRVANPTWPQGV
jgi:phage gp36-like protein